jgi:glutathione S-transferase
VTTTLWHIEISHYNEKARWALDYKGIPHRRRAPLPGTHELFALVLTRGGQRRFPVLDIDGRKIGDSTAIIAALEERQPEPSLYPDDPAERARALALEDHFDEHLAPAIRILGFYYILQEPEGLPDAIMPRATGIRRRALAAATPVVKPFMRRDYGVAAENAGQARADILAAMDRLEAELDGRDYLVGDRFSVADLTAAALFTPMMAPPERPYAPRATSAELLALRAELDARPGGRWVHEMYRRHRGTSAEFRR